MPKVSIIVPVYKTKAYLQKCVDSICAQTYSDFEIILVDDGSPDESGIMCDRLALCDNRISVIHKENGGAASARLSGFRKATGEYILFTDSDDYIHPNMLEELVNAGERENAQLVICGYTVVTHSSTKEVLPPYNFDSLAKNDICHLYQLPLVGHIRNKNTVDVDGFLWNRLYRKEYIVESYFISERDVISEDEVFNLYYSTHIDKIAIIHKSLYYYVQHAESLSNSFCANKWEKHWHKYTLCADWLKSHNLYSESNDNLVAAAFTAVCSSLDNAIALGNYHSFMKETNHIRKSALFKQALKGIKIKNLSVGQAINYSLIRFHFWRLFFKYRKKRLSL